MFIYYSVSSWMNDINDKIKTLTHPTTTTTTNNNTRTINHLNASKTIINNSTINPPIPAVFLSNVQSWGNKTCDGQFLKSNSFIFNMTATVTNTTPNTIHTEILFQLDNATVTPSDHTYYVEANSSLNFIMYKTQDYCQFSGPQDFEVVLMLSTGEVIETVRIR